VNVNNITGNLSVSGTISTPTVNYNTYGTITASSGAMTLAAVSYAFQNLSASNLAVIDASGNFTATGNVTAYSDQRLKNDIKTIEDALDKVRKLRGVSYVNANTNEPSIGVIAQEVKEVIPEVVQDNGGLLSVAYGNLVGVLIEAVKELSAKVDALESK